MIDENQNPRPPKTSPPDPTPGILRFILNRINQRYPWLARPHATMIATEIDNVNNVVRARHVTDAFHTGYTYPILVPFSASALPNVDDKMLVVNSPEGPYIAGMLSDAGVTLPSSGGGVGAGEDGPGTLFVPTDTALVAPIVAPMVTVDTSSSSLGIGVYRYAFGYEYPGNHFSAPGPYTEITTSSGLQGATIGVPAFSPEALAAGAINIYVLRTMVDGLAYSWDTNYGPFGVPATYVEFYTDRDNVGYDWWGVSTRLQTRLSWSSTVPGSGYPNSRSFIPGQATSGYNLSGLIYDQRYGLLLNLDPATLRLNDQGQVTSIAGTTYAALTDVALSGLMTGQIPTWDGTHWVNTTLSPETLAGLTDVTLSALTNGDFLLYDSGLGKWVNRGIMTTPGDMIFESTAADTSVDLAFGYGGGAYSDDGGGYFAGPGVIGAFDHDPTTAWWSNTRGSGVFCQVDMGTPKFVSQSQADIPGNFIYEYQVQGSNDGSTFVVVATGHPPFAPSIDVLTFAPIAYRYWRFYLSSLDGGWGTQLAGWSLYGPGSVAAGPLRLGLQAGWLHANLTTHAPEWDPITLGAIDQSGATSGQIPVWDGTHWVPGGGTGNTRFFQSLLLAAAASFSVSSIPGGFSALRYELVSRSDGTPGTAETWALLQLNGDTGANYDWQVAQSGAGSAVASTQGRGETTARLGYVPSATAGANESSVLRGEIPLYDQAVFRKQLRGIGSLKEADAGSLWVTDNTAYWRNTAPVTSLVFSLLSGNFVIGSRLTLWLIP